jgi:hypothetical protein
MTNYSNEADADNYEQAQILGIYSTSPEVESSADLELELLETHWVRPSLDRVPPIHIGNCDRLFSGRFLQLVRSVDGKTWLCTNNASFLAHQISAAIAQEILIALS